MKSFIVTELCKQTPKIRLVSATVAKGMGVDAPSIQRVIHMHPLPSLEKYLQDIGRAGRNKQAATAICYCKTVLLQQTGRDWNRQ